MAKYLVAEKLAPLVAEKLAPFFGQGGDFTVVVEESALAGSAMAT
jgi:hypothetical protein